MEKGYKNLEIYQLAHRLAVKVHEMTLALPQFERFEEGSQVRRSSKSVASNIVEGYALRRYKNEFIHYLFRAYGSGEETIEHLELLYEMKSLVDEKLFKELFDGYNSLVGKTLRYIQAVDKTFETPLFMKESEVPYVSTTDRYPDFVADTDEQVSDTKHKTLNEDVSQRKPQTPDL